MEYYRTIGKEERYKLMRGETIFPINKWDTAFNSFPKDIRGVYLYRRDEILPNSFYNYMGGEYIVILELPDDRIIAKGTGTYNTNIPDEDGWYGIVDVDEFMIEHYSMNDVIRIINIKKECDDNDDWYFLREGDNKNG